jgi:hypothetical protein
MTKPQAVRPEMRDIIIALLCLAVIGTNYLWYQSMLGLSRRFDAVNTNDYKQYVQIQELKACIDKNVSPCQLP